MSWGYPPELPKVRRITSGTQAAAAHAQQHDVAHSSLSDLRGQDLQ